MGVGSAEADGFSSCSSFDSSPPDSEPVGLVGAVEVGVFSSETSWSVDELEEASSGRRDWLGEPSC